MKVKVKSYEIKNKSAPGTKAKILKTVNTKKHVNIKRTGGIKDNRKYINDPALSEVEKLSRRMALENMKRKSSNNMSKNPKLFSKNADGDDTWDNDPFLLKVKQMGQFDEGLDESSSDDDDDQKKENTEKYFANGLFSQKKPNSKKTLDEIIRDSKIERFEKSKSKDKDAEATRKADEIFRNELRPILPKLGTLAKAKSTTNKFQADQVNYGDMFQKNFGSLKNAPRPDKADGKSIKPIPVSDKDNKKLANLKIKKLREYLIKEGIKNDDDESENLQNNSDLDESDDNDESIKTTFKEGKSGKLDNENSDESVENIEDSDECVEDDDDSDESVENGDDSDECVEDDDDSDENVEDGDDSDESVEGDDDSVEFEKLNCSVESTEIAEPTKINTNEDCINELKKLINESNKPTKRKLEDFEKRPAKKCREDNDSIKNQIDCFRALLQMEDLRKDALLKLVNEMNAIDIDEKNFSKRLILAYIFQHALKSDSPNSYSPELIGFVRFFLKNASQTASTWLSLKTAAANLEKSDLLNVCAIHDEIHKAADQRNVVVSSLFHLVHLLVSIINCNRHLTNKHALFLAFGEILQQLPKGFYPSWLIDKVDEAIQVIEVIRAEAYPQMLRMKKVFHIVPLLEPDLEDKYDPKKNLTKVLKEKVKKEKKSLKKEMKLNVKSKILNEIAESKKESQFRAKKTMEIMNGLSSR